MRGALLLLALPLLALPAAGAVDAECVRALGSSARVVLSAEGFAPGCVHVQADARVLFTSGEALVDAPVESGCFRTQRLSAPGTGAVDVQHDEGARLLFAQDAFARRVCAREVDAGALVVIPFWATLGSATHAGELRVTT